MTDKPTIRALTVFASVARHGPVTLTTLTQAHPDISRAAIWRALDNLRMGGWIRMRPGDNAFVTTMRVDDIMANATNGPRALEELQAKMPDLPKEIAAHFGVFTEIGKFEIVESSVDDNMQGLPLHLLDDPTAFVALATEDKAQMLRHLNKFIKTDVGAKASDLITFGGIKAGLRAMRDKDVVWMDKGQRCCFAYRSNDGSVVSCMLEMTQGADVDILGHFVDMLLTDILTAL